jgi:hypothetical protein
MRLLFPINPILNKPFLLYRRDEPIDRTARSAAPRRPLVDRGTGWISGASVSGTADRHRPRLPCSTRASASVGRSVGWSNIGQKNAASRTAAERNLACVRSPEPVAAVVARQPGEDRRTRDNSVRGVDGCGPVPAFKRLTTFRAR